MALGHEESRWGMLNERAELRRTRLSPFPATTPPPPPPLSFSLAHRVVSLRAHTQPRGGVLDGTCLYIRRRYGEDSGASGGLIFRPPHTFFLLALFSRRPSLADTPLLPHPLLCAADGLVASRDMEVPGCVAVRFKVCAEERGKGGGEGIPSLNSDPISQLPPEKLNKSHPPCPPPLSFFFPGGDRPRHAELPLGPQHPRFGGWRKHVRHARRYAPAFIPPFRLHFASLPPFCR